MARLSGLIVFLFTLTLIGQAQVTNTTGNGNWSNGGNWNNGVLTSTGTGTVNHNMVIDQDIIIEGSLTVNGTMTDPPGGGAYKFDMRGAASVVIDGNTTFEGDMTLENTANLTIKGCDTLTVAASIFKNSSTVTVEACAVFIINGDLLLENDLGIVCDGEIIVNGNLHAKNEASVTGSGSISTTGTVTIDDNANIFGNTSNCNTPPCNLGPPLPVELLEFNAELIVDHVDIVWVTTTEINNDYYTVERTINGIHYETVAIVDGAGNSNQTIEYKAVDEEPYAGISYYRLKQTDFDGTHAYTDPVAIMNTRLDLINLYPNPSVSDIQIIVGSGSKQDVQVRVYDHLGRIVLAEQYAISTGLTTLLVPVKHLAEGVYSVQASTTSGLYRSQKQFVKN